MSDNARILDDALVREFVESARVAHLATADSRGAPHVVPLCFALVSKSLYFVIDEKPKRETGVRLKRMRNIAENPNVAVVVDHYEEDWRRLAYVMIRGRAATVADESEYARALDALRKKYPQYRAMNLTFEKNPMVRIECARVHAWGERFK